MPGRRQFIQQLIAMGTLTAGTSSFGIGQALAKPKSSVGVVLDPLFFKHTQKGHPESAARLEAIDQELTRRNLWDKLTPVASRMATTEELTWVHDPNYVIEIARLSETNAGYFDPYAEETYVHTHTFDAAKTAVGSAIELNLAVFDRKLDCGFGLYRPPGHHALKAKAMGFCIFNSDVIAAKALQKYRGVERVAIIDFDVHHGNGTQDLTIDDPSILAISIHQHPYWPMTGGVEHTGEGKAQGSNMNLPFFRDAGDKAYLEAFNQVIYPKLKAFKPDHIIVFAGYDSHWADPLAQHLVTVNGFNKVVARLKDFANELCQGRLCLSLGGGYKLEPLAHCVAGTFEVLLGETPSEDTIGPAPRSEADTREHIRQLKLYHKV